MHKKTIIVLALIIVESCFLFLMYKSSHNKPVVLDEVVIKQNDVKFTFMLEQNAGKGDYIKSNETNFIKDNYQYNSSKSKCVDPKGNIIYDALNYNEINDLFEFDANEDCICYLYYDKKMIDEEINQSLNS